MKIIYQSAPWPVLTQRVYIDDEDNVIKVEPEIPTVWPPCN